MPLKRARSRSVQQNREEQEEEEEKEEEEEEFGKRIKRVDSERRATRNRSREENLDEEAEEEAEFGKRIKRVDSERRATRNRGREENLDEEAEEEAEFGKRMKEESPSASRKSRNSRSSKSSKRSKSRASVYDISDEDEDDLLGELPLPSMNNTTGGNRIRTYEPRRAGRTQLAERLNMRKSGLYDVHIGSSSSSDGDDDEDAKNSDSSGFVVDEKYLSSTSKDKGAGKKRGKTKIAERLNVRKSMLDDISLGSNSDDNGAGVGDIIPPPSSNSSITSSNIDKFHRNRIYNEKFTAEKAARELHLREIEAEIDANEDLELKHLKDKAKLEARLVKRSSKGRVGGSDTGSDSHLNPNPNDNERAALPTSIKERMDQMRTKARASVEKEGVSQKFAQAASHARTAARLAAKKKHDRVQRQFGTVFNKVKMLNRITSKPTVAGASSDANAAATTAMTAAAAATAITASENEYESAEAEAEAGAEQRLKGPGEAAAAAAAVFTMDVDDNARAELPLLSKTSPH